METDGKQNSDEADQAAGGQCRPAHPPNGQEFKGVKGCQIVSPDCPYLRKLDRAGVERVMGFCFNHDNLELMRMTPESERMLFRSGIVLVKLWFSGQEKRPMKRHR